MWIKREGFATIDLSEIDRIIKSNENTKISIKFEFKRHREKWSKYHFATKEERDEYLEALHNLLEVQEVEMDVIGKLK